MVVRELKWCDVFECLETLYRNTTEGTNRAAKLHGIYGIPTGGSIVAAMYAARFSAMVLDQVVPGCVVIDDLIDSGKTLADPRFIDHPKLTLYRKAHSPKTCTSVEEVSGDCWLKFPWERDVEGGEDGVVRLLETIGENPGRDGLKDTPSRVVRAMREMTAGMTEDPKVILSRTFDVAHDEIVMVRGIRFTSLCEHHMLPFSGEATVGYLPGKRIVGLSKLARLVLCFARRLQVQERLTSQVTEAIMEHLDAKGAGCIITASHACMGCRGVKQPDADMLTSSMLGLLRSDSAARAEFLSLAR